MNEAQVGNGLYPERRVSNRHREQEEPCGKSMGSTFRDSDLVGLGWGPRICILTNSQLMLLVWGPHCKTHCSGVKGRFICLFVCFSVNLIKFM